MSIAILRFFNVYGLHQDFLGNQPPFTGYVAKCLANDEAPTLYNDCLAERDYIYVDDLISPVINIANEIDEKEIYNIGSGVGFSVPKLYQIFLEVSGKNIKPFYKNPCHYWDKYPSLHNSSYPFSISRISQELHKEAIGNMSKSESEFGWKPSFTIKEGIKKIYDFILKNK